MCEILEKHNQFTAITETKVLHQQSTIIKQKMNISIHTYNVNRETLKHHHHHHHHHQINVQKVLIFFKIKF